MGLLCTFDSVKIGRLLLINVSFQLTSIALLTDQKVGIALINLNLI